MIDQSIITRIDSLWNIMHTNGMTDSLVNIEQLSYLIFFKRIDTIQTKKEQMAAFWDIEVTDPIFDALHEECRWSRFRKYSGEKMFRHMTDKVFPFIRYTIKITDETSYARYMHDADFRFSNPSTLKAAVEVIDESDLDTADPAREFYEYLLTRIQADPDKGQFTTPPFLVDLMVRLTKPSINDKICDPAMGNASLLASSARYVHENDSARLIDQAVLKYYNSEMFSGIDIDQHMLGIAAMNMILADIPNADLQRMDSLSGNNFASGEYSLILTSPPFSTNTDINYVSESLTGGYPTNNTAILFFRLIMRMLRSRGRCAMIVPDVLLFGVRKANLALKQELLSNHRIDGIISLSSSNLPYFGRTSCSLLLFTKDVPEGTDQVWFYDLTGSEDISNLLHHYECKEQYRNNSRYERSFFVSHEEIENNNYMLIMNRYRKDAGMPVHDSARTAMKDLEIANNILRGQLNHLEEL